MKKYMSTFAVAAVAVVLLGAGCSGSDTTDTADIGGTMPTGTTSTNENPADYAAQSGVAGQTSAGFNVTAESLGDGKVKMTWTLPANFPAGSTVRLLHSGSEHPSFPTTGKFNPFWQQVTKTDAEYTFTNVTKGTRFFRACEFTESTCVGSCEFPDGRCENYSNEVTVDVK